MSKANCTLIGNDGNVYTFDHDKFKQVLNDYIAEYARHNKCTKKASLEFFCEQIQKSESTVKNWKEGRNAVSSFATVDTLAKALNIAPYSLLIAQGISKVGKREYSVPDAGFIAIVRMLVSNYENACSYVGYVSNDDIESFSDNMSFELSVCLSERTFSEHDINYYVVFKLLFAAENDELNAAGSEVYMAIDFGEGNIYKEKIASFSSGAGEWEALIKHTVERAEADIEHQNDLDRDYFIKRDTIFREGYATRSDYWIVDKVNIWLREKRVN